MSTHDASVKPAPAYSRADGVPVPTVDHLADLQLLPVLRVGQRHSGRNNIWYRTYGDVTGRWGYVAAAAVFTDRDLYPGVAPC